MVSLPHTPLPLAVNKTVVVPMSCRILGVLRDGVNLELLWIIMVILVKDDTWLISRLTEVPSLLYIGGLSLPFRDF